MTTTPITIPSLIQRRGDAELPANGNWILHPVSFVGVSTGQTRGQLQVSDGVLNVTDTHRPSTLTIVAAQGDRWLRLVAASVDILADRHGMSTWHLTGDIEDGTIRHAVDVHMTYHGVRRRSDQAWAWFTGRATKAETPPRILRRRSELRIVLDLLFNAPLMSQQRPERAAQQLVVIDARQAREREGSPTLKTAC